MAEKKKTKHPSFEKALERLECIVRDMEGGGLDLDKMMAHFEEGNELVRFCSGKLNEVEKKIEVLVKKSGDLIKEPFEQNSKEK